MMDEEPQKVVIQASRIDASILPPGFSIPYRLYVIQQTTDLKNIADASNNAGDLAYQAVKKNEEQDEILSEHDKRLKANTDAISTIFVRVSDAEGNIALLKNDVNYLLAEIVSIESDMISRSEIANQSVQSSGGSFLIGNIPSPSSDKLQIQGAASVSDSYKVSGQKVVGQRQTGFIPATGTALKSAFNADQSFNVSDPPTQNEVGDMARALYYARQRIKALEDAMRSHGLID